MKQILAGVKRVLTAFDWPLLAILVLFSALGLVIMRSAAMDTEWRFDGQIRNFVLAFFGMWVVAMIPPKWLMKLAVPGYLLGIALLVAVMLFGQTSKGATRWLNLGVMRIQPSEMIKIVLPLMLAWYFQRHEGRLRVLDFLVAGVLLIVPFLLIVRQPDLGTALLVFGVGFCVIYFAGLSFKLLIPLVVVLIISVAAVFHYEDTLCSPNTTWMFLHDYQKQRVCTLLNPSSDPLGQGFHTIQSMIAVGSGGLYGKGYMKGTQSHLDFIPEHTTDFIFAVLAEEFGWYGGVLLLILYALLIARGLAISIRAPTQFGRLLGGALTMMFFVYVFVNVGMVSGILPVVGVPLPFLSYGGTALTTAAIACGILMSIHRHRAVET